MKFKYLVGVDEAGRGPLAGPVTVGVVVVPAQFDWESMTGVGDSKKVSPKERERIAGVARELKRAGEIDFRVAQVSASVIDDIGITRAVTRAIVRAIRSLKLDPNEVHIKLDGLLKAPSEYPNQETIIKGDVKEKVIGLASILAKVARDRYMTRIARRSALVRYDFATHKGYGTKAHCASIVRYGLSDMHRRSYCRNLLE